MPEEVPVPAVPPADEPVPAAEPVEPKVLVTSSYWPAWTIVLLRLYGYCGYRSAISLGPRRLVIRARSTSSCMLPRRSQAIAFSQATESTGVHFPGL